MKGTVHIHKKAFKTKLLKYPGQIVNLFSKPQHRICLGLKTSFFKYSVLPYIFFLKSGHHGAIDC